MARKRRAILIVDDEQEIRSLLVDCLTAAGYLAYEAADAQTALMRLAEHPAIKLVLTDIVMPGAMSGFQLAETLAVTHPALKVVLMSGYAREPTVGPPDEPMRILHKPFRLQQVLATVEALLAGNGGA